MLVYLGGGIHGLSFDEAGDWREEAIAMLESADNKALNPMRNRLWNEPNEQEQFTPNELVARDRRDIMRCDVLLVELTDPVRNYIGTSVEMAWAKEWSKPIVVFTGGRQCSPWLDYLATKLLDTMEEAVEYINTILGD